jgi:hypothetical protein
LFRTGIRSPIRAGDKSTFIIKFSFLGFELETKEKVMKKNNEHVEDGI